MPTSSAKPLFVITHEFFPRRGGIATFTEEMARACCTIGYDVEVWAQQTNSKAHPEKAWPFRLKRLPLPGSHDLSCQLKLMRNLVFERRRLRRATVYLPEPGPMLAMMLLQHFSAFRPKHLYLTFHGSEILRFARSPSYKHLAGKLIQKSTRISTLTNYTKNLLCEHFPMAKGKVFLTPGALRSDFADVESTVGAPKRKVVVLTVARLHPRKGQMITLQALQALPPHLRDRVEYWLVGSHSKNGYEAALRDQAARGDLKVLFWGDVSDDQLDLLYDQADIFAMTSIEHGSSVEGFGLVYLEASAHGLPVIGHDVGGVSEAMIDGGTGILVPLGNLSELTASFEKLITDPVERRRLGEAGKIWARKHRWVESANALFS